MVKMRGSYNPECLGCYQHRPVIYIICEGKQTEINYFKHFRTRNCPIDVVPLTSKYTAAEHLVSNAGALTSQMSYHPEEGDQIWCVFDRDDNTNEMLSRAKQEAQRRGYKIAFSNPSLEIWFLYHFCDQATEVSNCDSAMKLLKQKGRLEDYEKNRDVYAKLKPMQNVAIKRANKRISNLEMQHTEVISRQSNPVTTVVELVEYLNSKQARDTTPM